jgi:hypothetical protein
MTKTSEGGFAFPTPTLFAPDGTFLGGGSDGMTLRDHFAGKVLAGFCANPAVFAGNDRNGWDLVNCTEPQLAQVAYRIAGEMIAAREGCAA